MPGTILSKKHRILKSDKALSNKWILSSYQGTYFLKIAYSEIIPDNAHSTDSGFWNHGNQYTCSRNKSWNHNTHSFDDAELVPKSDFVHTPVSKAVFQWIHSVFQEVISPVSQFAAWTHIRVRVYPLNGIPVFGPSACLFAGGCGVWRLLARRRHHRRRRRTP